MARPLEARLQDAGLIPPDVAQRAAEHQRRTGLPVGDCLVTEGVLAEDVYLRCLAREGQAQFVLSAKLAKLRVPEAVLERVPVRIAERHSVLPVAYDEEAGTLTIACADPTDDEVLAQVRGAAKVEGLVRVVALESSIQAAIKQLYYRDPNAFTADGQPAVLSFRCTQCQSWLSSKDFQCPTCELLVNDEARDESKEPSIIRALIGAPEANPGSGARLRIPSPPDDPATRLAVRISADLVPRIIAGLDILERPLHPFEAYIVSRTDGQITVGELAELCGMGIIEVQSVFTSLVDRGVIELDQPARPPAPEDDGGVVVGRVNLVQVPAPPAEDPTQNLLERVTQLERAGKMEEAMGLLMQGISQLPRPAPLYNRLALVLVNQRDDYLGAERILRMAVTLEPDNPVFKQNLQRVVERVPKIPES